MRRAARGVDAIHDNVATNQDLEPVRADLRELELRLQVRLETMEGRIDRVVVRLGPLIVALSGVIVAAIRYPPHAGRDFLKSKRHRAAGLGAMLCMIVYPNRGRFLAGASPNQVPASATGFFITEDRG